MAAPLQIEKQAARDGAAWAVMLATVANGNVRLKAAVDHAFESRSPRRSVLEQLESERGRIARELHAGAGQPLAGIKLNLELLDSSGLRPEAAEILARMRSLTDAALAQIRAVSHRLHPPDWQARPVDQALKDLICDSGIQSRCRTTVLIEPLALDLPMFAKTALYRCAQECLSNIIRHSGATTVRFELSLLPGWVQLRVSDNGVGMPADAATRGIGLKAIREHAEAADGVVHVSTSPTGATLTIAIPAPEE